MKEICFANFFPISFFLTILFISFLSLPAIVSAGSISLPPNNLGLVGYWSFEDATGTKATDFSGNGNVGTLTNMIDADWVNGKIGKALDFDGSNDLIEVDDSDYWNFGTGAFSIGAWVKWNALSTAVLIGTNTSSSAEKTPGWYLLYNNGTNVLAFDSYNGGWQTAVSGSFTPSVGAWYHIVVKREAGGALSILVNGTSISGASTDTSDIQSGAFPLSIGGINGTTAPSFSNTQIDEVRIYSRALSATEITNLYNRSNKIIKAKTGISNNGLVGYWSFEDATGTKATDFSGQGNTGTLTNMDGNTDWINGKIGKALDFDGTNDYISVGDTTTFKFLHGALNTSGFTNTISFWVKINDITLQETYGLLATGDSGSSSVGINIYYDNLNDTRRLTYTITNGNSGQPVISSVNSAFFPDDNNWHLVTISYDQSLSTATAKLYLDGSIKSTSNKTGNTPSTSNSLGALRIGALVYDPTYSVNGQMDEVRIYNRALSASEVSTLYGSTKITKVNSSQNNKLTNGLVGLWSFDGKDVSISAGGGGADFTVSGAGTTAYNGDYNATGGTNSGYPIYKKDGEEYYMFYNAMYGEWEMNTEVIEGPCPAYYQYPAAETPDGAIWSTACGEYPDPIVTAGGGGGGSTAIAYDRSGNNNHGTLTNGPTPTAGKIGQGMSFDGTDDYVLMPYSSLYKSNMGAAGFAFSFWVKPNVVNARQGIISTHQGGVGDDNDSIEVELQANGTLLYYFQDTSANAYLGQSNTVFNAGQWVHIMVIRATSGTISLYVNGVFDSSISGWTGAILDTNSYPLSLGRYATYYLNGSLDDFRIYNRALSTSEIQMLYNMGR